MEQELDLLGLREREADKKRSYRGFPGSLWGFGTTSTMRSDFAFLLKKSNRPVRCFLSTSRPPKGPSFLGRFFVFLAGLLLGADSRPRPRRRR